MSLVGEDRKPRADRQDGAFDPEWTSRSMDTTGFWPIAVSYTHLTLPTNREV